MGSRYLQTLLPSTEKVSYVELHPTLPWLACFDRNDYLTVWDWHKQEVVMECQLGSNTQLNRQDVELHMRSESDINFFGTPLSEYVARNYTIGQATGKIRSVSFVDLDSIYWKASMQTLFSQGPAATSPSVSHLRFLADCRYLMIVAERAVILMDLLSKRVKTIPSAAPALGGKAFSDAVFLLRDVTGSILAAPLVAIACSDHAIRVVDALQLTVHHVLVSGLTAPISCMIVVPCPTAGGDWLIVGDEKGNVIVWRPLGAIETTPPVMILQHKEQVLSLLYIPWVDDTGAHAPRLGVVTADNRISVYDVKSMKALYKVKVLEKSKVKVTGACVAASSVASERSSCSIIVSSNIPVVFAFSADDCKMPHVFMNLESSIPARTDKKEAKMYHIASHPLRPDIVAVATNAGVAILRTAPQRSFPICGLNRVLSFKQRTEEPDENLLIAPTSPTGADESAESLARSVSFVTFVNGKLEGATYKAQAEDGAALDRVGRMSMSAERVGVNEPALSILMASRCAIGAASEGVADVKANAAGNMVAVCWRASQARQSALKGAAAAEVPEAGLYRVFRLMSDEGDGTQWAQVDEGTAAQVAWHLTQDMLAVLVVPRTPEMAPAPARGKAATREAAAEMALREADAMRGALAAAYVNVVEFTPHGGVQQRLRISGSSDASIVGIHGGALLGVVKAPLSAPTPAASRRLLQFYDWEMGLNTGIELPEPLFTSYAPSGEYAALAYAEGIDVFELDASFRRLTRLGIRAATSAVWNGLQLFTTTANSLFVTFVVPPAEPDASLTRRTNLFEQTGGDGLPELSTVPAANTTKLTTIELATLSVGSSRDFKKVGVTARTELPPLSIRPGNNAQLLRATDSTVWMVTCHGHPCALSLRHPGLMCRQLASAGNLKAARQLAQRSLDAQYHDGVALFFSGFGQDGVAEALLLPGLTLELELALSIKCGALKRGWACLASLLAGCKDSTLLCRFAAWNCRDVDPDKVDEPAAGEGTEDPFGAAGGAATLESLGKGLNNAEIENVLAVFTQAAGITAPHILARLIPTGVQGRKTALDEDFFSSAPEGDSPQVVAKVKAPPPATKYKPMFPRATIEEDKEYELEAIADGPFVDVIDWDLPLRKAPAEPADELKASGDEEEGDAGANGEAAEEAEDAKPAAQPSAAPIGANTAPDGRVLELGIQLLDASVNYADVHMLQQTIQLLAPHTGIMTPAQQQRMMGAVGACGLASHLSDLTLSGTTPLMPVTAMLAGFLSGDAIVASRVLEKEGLLPLKALFTQSCGAGGLEATVEWEQHLRGLLGGPTRQLTITPTTS